MPWWVRARPSSGAGTPPAPGWSIRAAHSYIKCRAAGHQDETETGQWATAHLCCSTTQPANEKLIRVRSAWQQLSITHLSRQDPKLAAKCHGRKLDAGGAPGVPRTRGMGSKIGMLLIPGWFNQWFEEFHCLPQTLLLIPQMLACPKSPCFP